MFTAVILVSEWSPSWEAACYPPVYGMLPSQDGALNLPCLGYAVATVWHNGASQYTILKIQEYKISSVMKRNNM
jgi:hypothetical protein